MTAPKASEPTSSTSTETPATIGLMTDAQTATYLGLSPRTLVNWRARKKGPRPALRIGRAVYYRRADVDAWLEEQATKMAAGWS